jgi:hypothetical protein
MPNKVQTVIFSMTLYGQLKLAAVFMTVLLLNYNMCNWFMFSVATICITAFLTVFLHGQVPPALAGLALAYAAHISGVFQYTTRLMSETEVRFISVERLTSYSRVSNTNVCTTVTTFLRFLKVQNCKTLFLNCVSFHLFPF